MKYKRFLLALVCSLMVLPVIGYGQDEAVMFEDIDSDSSGCISRDEAKSYPEIKKDFSKIDTDNDNKICIDEYTAYVNKGLNAPMEVEIREPGAAPMR